MTCMLPECQTSAGCAHRDPQYGYCFVTQPALSISPPRVMPASMPIPSFGVTIAVLDRDGNVTIRTDVAPSIAAEKVAEIVKPQES